MNRFIVVVIDSFGIGAMEDVSEVRPQDLGSNTALHLINQHDKFPLNIPTLLRLGLMNSLGVEKDNFKKSENAVYGKSDLKHFGADSYFGHQEIAGSDLIKPIFHDLKSFIDEIEKKLIDNEFFVERIKKDNLELLKVNNVICIGDNMETDLGQAINVVGALDYCGMPMIRKVGDIVRSIVKVPRVIAFGGSNVTIADIENAIITKKGQYIGVDAPKSGVYKNNYHVAHIGYGVDVNKQVPLALSKIGVKNYFYGKTANIVYNPNGENYDIVDTAETFKLLLNDLEKNNEGFYFLNVQESDLAGHSQDSKKYIDVLNVSDYYLNEVCNKLNGNDILLVMADHGNDPTIGHSRHTREIVPILIDYCGEKTLKNIGHLKTMADVGQTVADYFKTKIEFGESFLNRIR